MTVIKPTGGTKIEPNLLVLNLTITKLRASCFARAGGSKI